MKVLQPFTVFGNQVYLIFFLNPITAVVKLVYPPVGLAETTGKCFLLQNNLVVSIHHRSREFCLRASQCHLQAAFCSVSFC